MLRYPPLAIWLAVLVAGITVFVVAAATPAGDAANRVPHIGELHGDVLNMSHTVAAAIAANDPSAISDAAGQYRDRWAVSDSAHSAQTRNAAADTFDRIATVTDTPEEFTDEMRAITGSEMRLLVALAANPNDAAAINAASSGVDWPAPPVGEPGDTRDWDAASQVHETLRNAGVDPSSRPGE